MLASITPLGERGRRSSWRVTAGAHIAGSIAGGSFVGALAGAAGSLTVAALAPHVRSAVLGGALTFGLLWELALGRVPGPHRQVDERWLDRYRGWVYGLGYGAQLGAGLATVVVSSAVYTVPVAAFLSAVPLTGGVIGAVAGGLRGATVLVAGQVATPQGLVGLHASMRRNEGRVRTASLVGQLALACAAGIAAGV